jgi:hypothetical protein
MQSANRCSFLPNISPHLYPIKQEKAMQTWGEKISPFTSMNIAARMKKIDFAGS